MRLNDTQTKLVGDFSGMPGWLGEILPSAYPERSVEGMWDFACQIGHVHKFVITAVALLGVTPPGVGTIASLNDVAALYGIDVPAEPEPADTQAARPFRILAPGETTMPPQTTPAPSQARAAGLIDTARRETADAAGVIPTVDDIRRAYYEEADWSAWIVEVQLTAAGPVLIVIDDNTGQLIRVPVTAKEGGTVEFGDPAPVLVSYVDAPGDGGKAKAGAGLASAEAFPVGRKVAASWPDRSASRKGAIAAKAIGSHSTATDTGTWDGPGNEANLSNDDGADEYRAAYAWADPDGDADTKAGYKFIHHFISSTGTVGAASTVGCSAGIGVLNGGRGGADIPDADVQGVYAHLAKHLSDADLTPPELTAGAPQPQPGGLEADPDVEGALRHGSYSGEHEHPHADGSGGVHHHLHSHAESGRHDHEHTTTQADNAAAGATGGTGRGPSVDFTEEQMAGIRKALGKKDGEEISPAEVTEAMAKLATTPRIDASAPETPVVSDGTYLVDSSIIEDWRNRALQGDAAVHELSIRERDSIMAAAVAGRQVPPVPAGALPEEVGHRPRGHPPGGRDPRVGPGPDGRPDRVEPRVGPRPARRLRLPGRLQAAVPRRRRTRGREQEVTGHV